MPPKTKSTVNVEEQLAETIEQQRKANGWTYEEFAERMKAVGYEIHPSAIQKIEKGTPRRRITVNELAAFAQVFNIPAGYLLDRATWDSGYISRDASAYALDVLREIHAELNRRDSALSGLAKEYRDTSVELAKQIQKVSDARADEASDRG